MNLFGNKTANKQPPVPQEDRQVKIPPRRVLILDKEGVEEKMDTPAGIPWAFRGKPICVAEKDKNDSVKLVPCDPLQRWRDSSRYKKAQVKSPESLYRALKWPEVTKVFRISGSFLEKLNTMLLIGLIGILCFFIYLIYSSTTGG